MARPQLATAAGVKGPKVTVRPLAAGDTFPEEPWSATDVRLREPAAKTPSKHTACDATPVDE